MQWRYPQISRVSAARTRSCRKIAPPARLFPPRENKMRYEASHNSDRKNLLPIGNKFLSVVFLFESYIDLAHRNAFFIR